MPSERSAIGLTSASPSLLERGQAVLIVYGLYFGGYGFVNRRLPLAACTDLTLSVDHLVPFVPTFVFPFYLAYVIVLIPALRITERRLLRHALISFTALVLVSCAVFALFPTIVPRPVVVPSSISAQLVEAIYRADRPCCAFPSLHVSSVALSALVLQRQHRKYAFCLWPCVLAVAASTVFIKQHVVADVAGGLALAVAVETVVHRVLVASRPAVSRELPAGDSRD